MGGTTKTISSRPLGEGDRAKIYWHLSSLFREDPTACIERYNGFISLLDELGEGSEALDRMCTNLVLEVFAKIKELHNEPRYYDDITL